MSNSLLAKAKALSEERMAALVEVKVPELESSVWVAKFLSSRDMMKLEAVRPLGEIAVAVRMVLLFARDEKGKRIFSEPQEEDIKATFSPLCVVKMAADFTDVLPFNTSLDDGKKN